MSIQLGNYHCMQVRAALRQLYCWLLSIVKVLLKYLNVSPNAQGIHHHNMPEGQDQQAPSQHQINIPTSVSHVSNHAHEASNDINPIMSLFQSKILSKVGLNLAVPMATGLLLNQYQHLTLLEARLIALAVSLGFAAIWNGILLKGLYPRTASVMEIFGVGVVIVALYGLVSSYLPPTLQWASWFCCAFSCLPLVLSLLPLKSAETTLLNCNPPRPLV